jgi:hypothetical protein
MKDKEFQIACSALDDCRKLIAAGKVQRWEVVKWGVSVNLALATVSVPIGPNWLLVAFSGFVAIASSVLVLHYNRRMTGARSSTIDIAKWLKKNQIDYESIIGADLVHAYSKGWKYDKEELIIFISILACSVLLTMLGKLLVVWSKIGPTQI